MENVTYKYVQGYQLLIYEPSMYTNVFGAVFKILIS